MAVGKMKYRILIASSSDKIADSIVELLPSGSFEPPLRAQDAGQLRRMLLGTDVDVVIINSPLTDEFGVDLAVDLAQGSRGVLLLVKNEVFDQVCAKVEDSGVLTLAKPMTRQGCTGAIRLVTALAARLRRMEDQQRAMKEKLEDIRLVNRAKWLLIEHQHMTEPDAHRYIEKQAMDSRLSRREIARQILEEYE